MNGALIILALIWVMGSIAAIYKGEQWYIWDNFVKYLFIVAAVLMVINGYLFYSPEIVNVAVTIDMNPSFQLALIVSIIEAICIMGPIHAIYSYKKYKEYTKER